MTNWIEKVSPGRSPLLPCSTYALVVLHSYFKRAVQLPMCTVTASPTIVILLGGGHSHYMVVRGCAALKNPLFRTHLSSGDPPFRSCPFPAPETHFHFCISRLQFLPSRTKVLASEIHILAKIRSGDSSFTPKNQFRRHYFWKPGWHIHVQIFVDYLPQDLAVYPDTYI